MSKRKEQPWRNRIVRYSEEAPDQLLAKIAAHRTGRRCYGLELEPRYADVILRRAEAEGLSVERVEP